MKIAICAEQEAFAERGDLNDFQVKEAHIFNSENVITEHKRRLKRKKIPEYRRINSYFKGTRQYWKERNRRKQVMELSSKGLTLKQIAKEIGCSYRTVRRDAVKIERYVRGKFNSHMTQLQREARAKLDAEIEALGVSDYDKRFKKLTNLMFKTRKLSQAEIEKQHNKVIVFDFDKPTDQGFPRILAEPGVFKTPYNISFVAHRDGENHVLGGITIG